MQTKKTDTLILPSGRDTLPPWDLAIEVCGVAYPTHHPMDTPKPQEPEREMGIVERVWVWLAGRRQPGYWARSQANNTRLVRAFMTPRAHAAIEQCTDGEIDVIAAQYLGAYKRWLSEIGEMSSAAIEGTFPAGGARAAGGDADDDGPATEQPSSASLEAMRRAATAAIGRPAKITGAEVLRPGTMPAALGGHRYGAGAQHGKRGA